MNRKRFFILIVLFLVGLIIAYSAYFKKEIPNPTLNSPIPRIQSAPNLSLDNNLVPINNKSQPLPHNGLFIRRNNEFGTKIALGAKELIEQGILIDQKMIRFDDFLAINSDQVPLPKSNYSLAINYGLAKIPNSAKLDQREETTHYLAIALKTVDIAPVSYKTQPLTANYIFVIDTSGSMEGEKIDAVKTSIRELITSMRKNDVIGIVGFNDQPKTLLRATPIEKIKTDEFSQILSSVVAEGGTDINLGLSFGIDEISRYGNELEFRLNMSNPKKK